MDNDERTSQFLDAATAGLSDDAELRLDVRGELASHIEETVEARLADGASDEEARAHALKAFGDLTDVAAEFVDANRPRMRRRARARLALRALLTPAAVVVALLAIRPSVLDLIPALSALGGHSAWPGSSSLEEMLARGRRLTPEQRLVLEGDAERETPAQRQRAIWEAFPGNRTYANHYVSYLLSGYDQLGGTDEERFEVFASELAAVWEVDPDNARCDYLLAAKQLDLACTVEADPVGKDDDGKTLYERRLVVTDRAILDNAMGTLGQGLRRREFRRHGREMLGERLRILGLPRTRLQQVSVIAMCAGTLLPDLSELRNLTRTAILYGELLVEEGRPEEAEPFLDAWKTMALQLNEDSFTLIDVLVVGALTKMGHKAVPPVYEAAGNATKAEQAREEAAALAEPVTMWRENRDSRPDEKRLLRSAGVLHRMLLPAVGELPTHEELAPGRYLDYVTIEQAVASAVVIGLLIAMIVCVVVALRWHLDRRCASAPILLLPGWRVMARALGFGVLLPIAGYYLLSRHSPVALRQYAVHHAWRFLAAEMLVLTGLVLCVPPAVARRAIRERCRALGIEHGETRFRFVQLLPVLLAGAALVVVVAVCAVAAETGRPPWSAVAAIAVAAIVLLVLVARFVLRTLGLLPGTLAGALRAGTVARSLIPVFASAIILFSFLTRPYLDHRETWLVQNDPLMRMDAESPGFTAVELRVTERLQKAVAEAAKGLESG